MSVINARVIRDSLGRIDVIHINRGTHQEPSWARVAFNPSNKTFDESDPFTQEFRAWEASHGKVDLSDHPELALPEQKPQDWSRETGLAGKLFGSTFHQRLANCTSDACNKAYSELLAAIANKSVPLLDMGLKRAIAALPDTPSEIAQVQGWLNECNIPITIQSDGNPPLVNVGVRL